MKNPNLQTPGAGPGAVTLNKDATAEPPSSCCSRDAAQIGVTTQGGEGARMKPMC